MKKQRSLPARMLLGTWHMIDGARKVVLNLVFFLIVYLVIVALIDSGDRLIVQPDTALVLRPQGDVVEQYSGTPLDHGLMQATDSGRQETSLRDLLLQLAESASGRTGIPIKVDVRDEPALPGGSHVALYRIAQEALNNVVKHSEASQAWITLHCTSPGDSERRNDDDGSARVELQVSDDGQGGEPRVGPRHHVVRHLPRPRRPAPHLSPRRGSETPSGHHQTGLESSARPPPCPCPSLPSPARSSTPSSARGWWCWPCSLPCAPGSSRAW